MAVRGSKTAKVGASWLIITAVVIGVPMFLLWVVGNPFPSVVPDWATISRDISQQNISEPFVIKTLALMVWVVWVQITWAIVWEAAVAGPRIAKGIRTRSAPLVARPLASLATRIVSAGLAAGVVTSTSQTSLPERIIVAPNVVPASVPQPVADNQVDTEVGDGQRWLVQPGDSLWSISGEDQSVAAQIIDLNGTVSSPLDVVAGVSLRVPESVSIPADRQSMPLDIGSRPPVDSGGAQRLVDHEPDARRASPSPEDRERDSNAGSSEGRAGEADLLEKTYWQPQQATVTPGDTIWALAENRLERANRPTSNSEVLQYVDEVVADNPEVLDDPDLIHPGDVLILPSIGEAPEVADQQDLDQREQGPEPNESEADASATQSNVVPLPPRTTDSDTNEPSIGLYDWLTRSRIDLGLGVGGAMLGAAALSLLRRRRKYRIAHRKRGTIPIDPDPRLDDLERLLQAERSKDKAGWMTAALASLSARPVWEDEQIPVPVLAVANSKFLEVTFANPDEMGAPIPWESVGDGKRWRLDRSIPVKEIPQAGVEHATPTFVTIADGVMLNLEGVGLLCVEGGSVEIRMGILRSIVHELAASSSARWVDIRSTASIPGTGSYPLVRHQKPDKLGEELEEWLNDFDDFLSSTGRSSTYAYRLSSPEEPVAPVVLLVEESDQPELQPVYSLAAERRLPVGVVQLLRGPLDPHVKTSYFPLSPVEPNATIRIDDDGLAILEPFGIEIVPQALSESTANDLGLLLQNASSSQVAPLVSNLQLSASITNLADRHKSSIAAKTAPLAGVESPWSALDPETTDDELAESAEETGGSRPEESDSEKVELQSARGSNAGVGKDTLASLPGERTLRDDAAGVPLEADRIDQNGGSGSDSEPDGALLDVPDEEYKLETRAVDGAAKASQHPGPALTALVLGEVKVVGLDVELTPQQLSLVTFLACVGEANKSTIVDALWDGKPISRSRFPNLLAETRAKIGRNTLPEAKAGVYRLNGISTDLGQFEQAIALASKQSASEVIDTLRSAFELVRGIPLTTPNGRYWTWVGDHTHLAARVESLVADAALRLADLLVEQGDLEGAIWACERGLLACPIDENLVASLAETYVASGKLGTARRLVDSWEDKINRLECGEPSDGPRNRLVG